MIRPEEVDVWNFPFFLVDRSHLNDDEMLGRVINELYFVVAAVSTVTCHSPHAEFDSVGVLDHDAPGAARAA
jgi:hypothetical protein